MKKQLSKRIEMLDSLRVEMEAKYGASDVLVLDLVEEVKSLRSQSLELKSRLSPRKIERTTVSKSA